MISLLVKEQYKDENAYGKPVLKNWMVWKLTKLIWSNLSLFRFHPIPHPFFRSHGPNRENEMWLLHVIFVLFIL